MIIQLKKITLLNFKGIRKGSFEFSETTHVRGRNGSGKTTLYDAFWWVLFGKDSLQQTDFGVKTLDLAGNPIERIPHGVEIVLSIDGRDLTLKRVMTEKWTKKRGSPLEEFTGHENTFYVNDVPCGTQKEYQAQIAQLCDEAMFKLITNPMYFPSQTKEVQRQILFSLAGDLSNEAIANDKPEFEALLNDLTGKTLEGLKKEIAAKKKGINDEIKDIPARIDERKNSLPPIYDWVALEVELTEKKASIALLEAQIADQSKATEEAYSKRTSLVKDLSSLKEMRMNLISELKNGLKKEWVDSNAEIVIVESQLNRGFQYIASLEKDLDTAIKTKEALLKERERLLSERQSLSALTLNYEEGVFCCPTCKRDLDINDIESKKDEMATQFNSSKTEKLADNLRRGLDVKSKIEAIVASIDSITASIETEKQKLSPLKGKDLKSTPEPEYQNIIENNGEYILLNGRINKLVELLAVEVEVADVSDLKDGKSLLEEAIDEIKKKLLNRGRLEEGNNRIKQLQDQQRNLAQELALLEKKEFNISLFSKAKIEMVEAKINGMFEIVKFNMYEKQINGGEKEICEASVEGVPFSDLNNAMRINAGLDIIRTICEHYGIFAPIWLDNRESITHVLKMRTQIINLVVDDSCVNLTIG